MKRKFLLLLAGATAFDGLRAGAGTFRILLELPARASLGPVVFAAFSRAVDLSTTGIIFYVVYGIGGALVTLLVWIAALRREPSSLIRWMTGSAFLCSMLILLLTIKAAPLMWRIGADQDPPAAIAGLLDRFTFWTWWRVICADFSFLLLLASLAVAAIRTRSAGHA